MSISVTLIPVVLVIRLAMGKDKFDNWIDSMSLKYMTDIQDENELKKIVRLSGFDANDFGGLIKTHIKYKDMKTFFFWDKNLDTYYADFSTYDNRELIDYFINKIEEQAGKKVFTLPDIQNKNVRNEFKNEPVEFPTNFADFEILVQTLDKYKIKYEYESRHSILCHNSDFDFKFISSGNSNIKLQLINNNYQKTLYEIMRRLDFDYKQTVQELSYNKVLKMAKDKGYKIESEEIQEDNSIILTMEV